MLLFAADANLNVSKNYDKCAGPTPASLTAKPAHGTTSHGLRRDHLGAQAAGRARPRALYQPALPPPAKSDWPASEKSMRAALAIVHSQSGSRKTSCPRHPVLPRPGRSTARPAPVRSPMPSRLEEARKPSSPSAPPSPVLTRPKRRRTSPPSRPRSNHEHPDPQPRLDFAEIPDSRHARRALRSPRAAFERVSRLSQRPSARFAPPIHCRSTPSPSKPSMPGRIIAARS